MPGLVNHGGSLPVKLMKLQVHNPAKHEAIRIRLNLFQYNLYSYPYMNKLSRCPWGLDKLFDFAEVEIYHLS